MGDDKNIRHRFTVPSADVKVEEWINAQSNLGFSLRVLIKAFVRQYGIQDATCLELGVQVKGKGRYPKSAQIRYGGIEEAEGMDAVMPDADLKQETQAVREDSPVQAQKSGAFPVENQTQQEQQGQAWDEQVNMNDLFPVK